MKGPRGRLRVEFSKCHLSSDLVTPPGHHTSGAAVVKGVRNLGQCPPRCFEEVVIEEEIWLCWGSVFIFITLNAAFFFS